MDKEDFTDLHFPSAGLSLAMPFGKQPNLPVEGKYYRTARVGNNVRGFEPVTGRSRGGARPGLSKYLPVAPVAGWLIQELNIIVIVDDSAIE